MRVRIHRGAREIGGSAVELECAGNRLVLDVGRALGADCIDEEQLPKVSGLRRADNPQLLGIIVSHGHADRAGLLPLVHPGVPIYLGEATARVLSEALFFTGQGAHVTPAGFLEDRRPFTLGLFRITPYLADHSAFDAYSLLIEAGGRSLFYSGDLRAHGRKPSLFKRLLKEAPATDVILLEGTRIGEQRTDERGLPSERAVEEQAVELFRKTEGIVLACYSPQNIDRLVSFFKAAKRSDRLFVLDLYGASIVRANERPKIPQATWSEVRVFVPQAQRRRVMQSGAFERTETVRSSRLFPEQLAALSSRLVFSFRGSMRSELERAVCLTGAHLFWGLWPGYLERPDGLRLRQWARRRWLGGTTLSEEDHLNGSACGYASWRRTRSRCLPSLSDDAQARAFAAALQAIRIRPPAATSRRVRLDRSERPAASGRCVARRLLACRGSDDCSFARRVPCRRRSTVRCSRLDPLREGGCGG